MLKAIQQFEAESKERMGVFEQKVKREVRNDIEQTLAKITEFESQINADSK